MRQIFARIDIDHNEVINEKDFRHDDPAIQTILQQVWQLIVAKFDFNHDREISKKEFKEGTEHYRIVTFVRMVYSFVVLYIQR